MPAWEYKFITSGKGGFATPALMESFLNQLGQEEWEILDFHSQPDNPLAFSALARRSTQREWSLEHAVTAAARAEADKLRAEFEAKFKGATDGAGASEEPEAAQAETDGGDRAFRKPRNTESDLDPDLPEDEPEADEWDKIAKEDELPTFFEAIQPLMRRNQRGEGLSAGVEHLAKKWGLSVHDVVAALKESGFAIPEDENDRPAYVEYDGDLFWVNLNRRGELWINTKEKPRQIFRVVPGRAVADEVPQADSAPSREGREVSAARGESGGPASAGAEPLESTAPEAAAEVRQERQERQASAQPRDNRRGFPEGQALLDRIHPLMRRERGGSGRSGSIGFLSRALKCGENELGAALEALGLALPAAPGEPPVQVELGGALWWLNRDQRGGIWINQRGTRGERRQSAERENGEVPPSPAGMAPAGTLEAFAGAEDKSEAPRPEERMTGSGEPEAAASGVPTEPFRTSGQVETPAIVPEEKGAAAPTPDHLQKEASATGGESADSAEKTGLPDSTVLSASRLLLKPTRTGAVAGEVGRLAETVGKSGDEFLAALLGAGLALPERPREKPVFVEHAGEIFWLNKNVKGELWLNAKTSKFSGPRRGGEQNEGDQPAAEGESQGRRGRRN